MREEEKTIQSIFNLWFWNFQNASLQQYSNLYLSTLAILKFFNKENKYDKEIAYLRELFFHPALKLNELYQNLAIGKHPLDWDIAKLEWCYFRDTRFRSKLSTEYYLDSNKMQETKKMVLGDMITVLSLFKNELFSKIVTILIDNKLGIYITLPAGMKEISQLEEGGLTPFA